MWWRIDSIHWRVLLFSWRLHKDFTWIFDLVVWCELLCVFHHRFYDDVLWGVWCTCFLANTSFQMGDAVFPHDEETDTTHDQIQICPFLFWEKGMCLCLCCPSQNKLSDRLLTQSSVCFFLAAVWKDTGSNSEQWMIYQIVQVSNIKSFERSSSFRGRSFVFFWSPKSLLGMDLR